MLFFLFFFRSVLIYIEIVRMDKLKNGLYIIGNGFDLHHGLKTSYFGFGEWLAVNNSRLYEQIRTYLFYGEMNLWKHFEDRLACIDPDTIFDEASNFLFSYGDENWSDSYHHSYQFYIEQITKDLSENLLHEFSVWIASINDNILNCCDRLKVVPINRNAHFLSFNYTSLLSCIYGVPEKNIKYIHGSCGDEIVLGHAYRINPNEYTKDIDEKTDVRVAEGYDLIQNYFESTFKPSEKIIEQNEEYFNSFCLASKVFVLGHSMGEVDIKYFEKIADRTRNIPWIVSFYDDEEKLKHRQTLEFLGIENFMLQGLDEIVFDL